jgi:hypothetical protein
MSRRPGDPERLGDAGASALERRLLDAASEELPSPELRDRMARAIGLSTAALTAGVAASKSTAAPPAPPAPSAWVSSAVLRWLSAGAATAAVAGAVVAIRASHGSPSSTRASSRVTVGAPAAPPPAPTSEAPVSTAAPPPAIVAPPSVPARERAESPVDDVASQIALVDTARAALSRGAADRALEILGHYLSRYPSGSFRPEAMALKIEALAKLGRNAEARALAERFTADHRGSPLADRIAREVGLPPR